MPRYPANSLESISLSREDLVDRALQAEPALNRRYDDTTELAALRRRLFAVERWASRIVASPPSRLMTAALLSPPQLASVINDLAAAAAAAAPPRAGRLAAGQLKSRAERYRRSPPTARGSEAESDADALIYMLSQLGEYVGGTWHWVPCHPLDVLAGDDDVPMEIDRSPPSAEVVAVVQAFGPDLGEQTRKKAERSASFAWERLHALARSAVAALDAKLRGRVAGLSIKDISSALENADTRAQAAHANLLATVRDLRGAMEPDAEARGSWWGAAGRSIAEQVDDWLETVPPALPITRSKRQQLKRDMETAFGYVMQYALLMQGNAASYDLVEMIEHLKFICERLRDTLDRILEVPLRQAATAAEERAVEAKCGRAIIPNDQLDRWRAELGADASRAGKLVREALGVFGQKAGLQMNRITGLAAGGRSRGGRRPRRAAGVERLLAKMQRVGLAVRLPVRALDENRRKTTRVGARRRIHDGRTWWFNPLGALLAAPAD